MQLCDDEINFIKNSKIDAFPIYNPKKNKKSFIYLEEEEEDSGVIVDREIVRVDREDVQLPCNGNKWKNIREKLRIIKNNSSSVEKFIIEETKSRKVDRKSSLTRPLNQEQWKACKVKLKQVLKSSDENLAKAVKNLLTVYLLYPDGQAPSNWSTVKKKLNAL